jgi:hypothetical protein
MEELPLTVKIVGLAICMGAVILLAAHDRLFQMLKRSLRSPKTK